MKLLTIVMLCLLPITALAGQVSFESNCAGTTFRVTKMNHGHPLDNSYVLSAVTTTGTKEIYTTKQDWFSAACLKSKSGQNFLVFQASCGGSGCLEGKYGVVNPGSLKLQLRPSEKNIENHKELSVLLGSPAPYLHTYKGAFCCGASKP